MDQHTPATATHPDARTATPHAWTQRQAEFERCTNQPTVDRHSVFDHFCYDCGNRINPPACSLTFEEQCDPNHPSLRGHERCFI